jgi:lipopolysaccharide biosynthesis glycosyltransferase
MINVVFCVHDSQNDYIKHTVATIISVLENTREDVLVHIIHDDTVTLAKQKNIIELVANYNQKVQFHRVNEQYFCDLVKSIWHHKKPPIGTLYRLKIADLIKAEKAVYLDSDIIVNMDIKDLWSYDIQNYLIAAVKDLNVTRYKWSNQYHFRKMKVSPDLYFNAGVIVFNLGKIRKELNLFEQAKSFFLNFASDARFFDQDALNKLLQDNTLFLPRKYNYIPVGLRPEEAIDSVHAIIHFAGPKPWNFVCSEFDNLYWKYLAKSSWADTTDKLLELQKYLKVDLGYALSYGKVGSRIGLLLGILHLFKSIAHRLGKVVG